MNREKIRNGKQAAGDPSASFPIVGIGASAGGLDAFTRFFDALPDDPDMAFVLIQHLDPNHESMMSDLLSRHTALRVMQVKERTAVKKNVVYIIPPGKYLGLENQHLVLSDPPQPRGMRMAIDHFFETLAEARREKAVCIILSGTASDGTLGLKAVKANGGLAIVQNPDTAQHDGMPRSAIATGAVDRILAPEDMPEVLLQYAAHPYVNGRRDEEKQIPASGLEAEDAFDSILASLRAQTGHEFKFYKKSTLFRRIQRRMSLNHLARLEDYLGFIRTDPEEAELLFKDLLINVTSFFREPEAWQIIERRIIPALIEDCDTDGAIRVWTPGCATGEEAYSIAMLLTEARERAEKRFDIQIFGTDIDKGAFQIARSGRYSESIAAQVPPDRLDRFFDKEDGWYVVKKALRKSVVFAPQSLVNDPPFSRLDLVICRNLLIYLENHIQQKSIRLFHFALRKNGYLFLGSSETIGSQRDLFEPLSKTWRIYQRLGNAQPPNIELPVFKAYRGRSEREPGAGRRRQTECCPSVIAQQAVLKHYAPAAVLIDRNHDVLYYQGATGDFLSQPEGEPTRNLLDQCGNGLRTKLRAVLHRATESGEKATIDDAHAHRADGRSVVVAVEATPLKYPQEAAGLTLVTFHEKPTADIHDSRVDASTSATPSDDTDKAAVRQLEYELTTTREELQSTIEELETSNQELKAYGEEVMSMNEELQSSNEELETSKEELQSLNEELTTVNSELREKVLELEQANDDMANLLASTHIPTVFLDRELRLKRFTPSVVDLWHMVPPDVGRRIDHIARRFEDPALFDDVRSVLRELTPQAREIRSEQDRWYIRRVLPYRTQDDRIAGVVITFIDTTRRHRHLEEIRAREDQLRQAILEAPLPVILFAEDGKILLLSKTWTRISGYDLKDIPTLSDWTTHAYGPRKFEVLQAIERRLEGTKSQDEGEFTITTRQGNERIWHFHSSLLGRLPDGRKLVIGMAIDVTDRNRFEKALRESEAQLMESNLSLEKKVEARTREVRRKSDQLRRLAAELSQAEQRERRQLASTLHDNLQQLIASTRLRLDMLSQDFELEDNEDYEQIRVLLEKAAEGCRDVTTQLAPPVLYEDGLISALKWLAKWFEKNHFLKVVCDIPDGDWPPVNENVRVLLFRSVRELLFNVVKHADVDKAYVTVSRRNPDGVAIVVQDRGQGFAWPPTEPAVSKQGFGLFSVRERIAMSGGTMDIQSSPGAGTRVRLQMPAAATASPKSDISEKIESIVQPAVSRMEPGENVHVLLVDDHEIFRDGLASILESVDGIEVVGHASDGAQAVEKARSLHPDVILMDINLPVMNGIEATAR